MKDYLDNELNVGDEIVYLNANSKDHALFHIGYIQYFIGENKLSVRRKSDNQEFDIESKICILIDILNYKR